MSLSLRKNLFFVLVNLLFLLSFLLAETYLGFYVLGVFCLVLLGFQRTFPLKKSVSLPLLLAGLIFLGLSALTLTTTISSPLSLYALTRYAFLIAFSFFFLRIDFTDQEKTAFFQLLIFQGLSLVFVSTLFFLLPEYGNKIPGMNVIFSTYGHNHLGAVLLMLTPLTFWLYLKEKNPWYLVIFGVFVLAMVFSFGRVVIFVGFWELILIGYLYLRWKKLRVRSFSGLLLLFLGVLMVGSLAFYIYIGHTNECLIEEEVYREQVCKTDLRKNVRRFYWDQAWRAFLNRPVTGYGVGTFGSISYFYRQIPNFSSSYAHNDYLQFFAEGGVLVGLSFIGLLGLLYWGTWEASRRSQKILLFFGLVGFGIDIFFDFDFNFFAMALLFFLLFVLQFKPPNQFPQQLPAKRLEPVITVLLVTVLLVTGLYGVADRLVASGKEDVVARYFPYFHWHSLNFMKSEKVSPARKKYLANVYWASPLTLRMWIESLTGEEKAEAEYQSWLSDPWQKTKSFLPNYYFEQQDVRSLKKVLVEITDFLDEKRTHNNFELDNIQHSYKTQWAKASLFLAQQALEKKDYVEAAYFLKRSYDFEEWILAQSSPLFTSLVETGYQPAMEDFLAVLLDIPAENIGYSRDQLARLYFEQMLLLLETGENDALLVESVKRVLTLSDGQALWFGTEVFTTDEETWVRLVDETDWRRFYRYTLLLNVLQTHPFENRSGYTESYHQRLLNSWFPALQRYIDALRAQSREEEVGQLLDALVKNVRDLNGIYWVQAQRGYWYGLIGNDDKAQEAFKECLVINHKHNDCQHGLDNLEKKGFPDISRYYEIRQLLLGI